MPSGEAPGLQGLVCAAFGPQGPVGAAPGPQGLSVQLILRDFEFIKSLGFHFERL